MSMIDCKINIEKKHDPKGDRVLLSFEYVVCLTLSILHSCFDLVASSYRMLNGETVLYERSLD